MDAPFSFNRSIRIGSRRDRITGDSGALTGRELLRRSGVVRFLAKRLPDKRDGRRIRHSQRRLARTLLLLAGQGRREHNDATELRDDPALRLATGDRAGTAPLGKAGRLPSQPTLSRRVAAWSAKEGVEVLREGLQRLAGWRLKAMGGWRRPKTLVIDIDSLPVEVHGEQPGSAWNGYYHRRVYHPIVASAGETGDILDLRLREGQVHTADGGLEFVLEVLERAERHLCGKAAVRFDAHPGALHRLGPPDHDDHRRRVGALAHARPRACDPARTPRIAGPPPGAEPFPGPGGRKDAEVSPSAGERLGQAEQLLLSDPERLFLAPGTAPTWQTTFSPMLTASRASAPDP